METSKINPEGLSLCFAKLVGLMQDRSSISSAKTCHFTDSFAYLPSPTLVACLCHGLHIPVTDDGAYWPLVVPPALSKEHHYSPSSDTPC